MNFIQKVTAPILPIGDVSSFSLIGDPGCEGLGTTMMRVYVNALELASRDCRRYGTDWEKAVL